MAKIDENLYLDQVSPAIYKELTNELNKNSNWQVLACHIAEQFGEQR